MVEVTQMSKEGYSQAQWNGETLYQCEACAFTSFSLAKIREHVVIENAPVIQPISSTKTKPATQMKGDQDGQNSTNASS